MTPRRWRGEEDPGVELVEDPSAPPTDTVDPRTGLLGEPLSLLDPLRLHSRSSHTLDRSRRI